MNSERGWMQNTENHFLPILYHHLGKLKKGTGYNENHEYNILLVLNREIFGMVGKTGKFVLLAGNYGKLSALISYRNCT
jgi:hypothetical protein